MYTLVLGLLISNATRAGSVQTNYLNVVGYTKY